MKDLAGKTAIITGGSTGIGLAVARALAQRKVNLVLAARTRETLETAARELRAMGADVLTVPTDVTETCDLERLVARAKEQFKAIHILVNNAGIETYRPLTALDPSEIAATINTNLTAAIILARLVIPHMQAAGGGHVVNMSSTAGKHGPAFGAAYGASKAGLIALTESLRGEFCGTGISASAICPGFTHDGGIYERMKSATGRGTPATMGSTTAEQVAQAVVHAIENDRPELLVNFPPMRPVFALAECFPKVGEWIIRRGTFRFLRRVATNRAKEPAPGVRRAA